MRKSIFDSIFAAGGALAAFLFGELNGLFYALIAIVVLDYVTGVLAAIVKKQLSSEVGFKGIVKKIFVFVIVSIAHIIDVHVIGNSDILRSAAICFFIANEALSILENAGSMGLPIPKKLLNILEQLKNNDKQEEI